MRNDVRKKCLKQFQARYPVHDKVIVVERMDGDIRVVDKDANSMIFSKRGTEIITHQYVKDFIEFDPTVEPKYATFEQI